MDKAINRVQLVLLFFLLATGGLFAQEGTLRGRVIDQTTRLPIAAAGIFVEEINRQAVTDAEGIYSFLGIPAGAYSLHVAGIGYADLLRTDVRIHADFVTTQDFALNAEVNASRDSSQHSASSLFRQTRLTHTVHFMSQEEIQRAPVRGLQNLLDLQAGAVRQDGALHVRGGRSGQVAYFIDGAAATNPFLNAASFAVIPEAIAEVQFHTGAYTADFGGANSALVRTILRAGGPAFQANVDYRTDDFAKPGEQFLGTSSFGYRNGIITLSGPAPLLPQLRFFVAGQHNYVRQRDAIFLEPFRFDNLRDDGFSGRLPGAPLPAPVVIKRNYLPKNWRQDNSVQGTLVYERNPFAVRFTGSYADVRNPLGHSWPEAMQNMFWRKNRREEERSAFTNLQATHHVSTSFSYNLALSYSYRRQRRFDSDFGDNWMLYADSAANAKRGHSGYQNRYIPPIEYSTIFGYRFLHESFPVETYERNGQTSLGASLALTTQINKWWLLKAGSNLEAWTMRLYRVGNIPSALRFLFGPDGQFPRQFSNDYEREIELLKWGFIDYYGYDLEGRKTDSGRNAPRRPTYIAAYIQNGIEYGKLHANLGLRYERFDLKVPKPADVQNSAYDLRLDYIEENKLVRTKPNGYWLPRFSFSFPLLNRTELFAAYGKYVQMPALREIYISTRELSAHLSPYTRGRFGPVGFSAKPERSTHFEVGVRQALGKNALLAATYFNKDFDDLLRPASVFGEPSPNQPEGAFLYTGWINRDQTLVQGLELIVTLQRTKRLAARVDYTFSKAEGTEADPIRLIYGYGYPVSLLDTEFYRLDYNQKHRGAITVDYRFDKGDGGKILEGLGLNVIMSFNSGHPYTQYVPLVNLGQSTAWEIGVRPLLDPYADQPSEPPNSSTTPWIFNVDLSLSRRFNFHNWSAEFYCDALNFFNARHKVNFYPQTGATEDDGWLTSPLAQSFSAIPNYFDFYRAINLQNRWAYAKATGADLFGAPRQIRLGMRVSLYKNKNAPQKPTLQSRGATVERFPRPRRGFGPAVAHFL